MRPLGYEASVLEDGRVKRFWILALLSATGIYAQGCAVTLAAKGVKSATGVVGFVLFDKATGWPEKRDLGYKNGATAAKPGTVEMKVEGIAPGKYAVVALHDENENKKLDKKGSGRPKEGFGISKDPKVGLKAPKFESAIVDLKCGDRLEMTMRYPRNDDGKETK
jgi:uncharacterized protein (DUF2141 family)